MLAAVIPQPSVLIVLPASLVQCPAPSINWFCGDSSRMLVYLTAVRTFASAAVGLTEEWRGLTRCMEAVGIRTGLLVSVLTKVLCSRLGIEAAGRNSRMVGKGQINKCLSHDTAVITLEPHYE